MKRTILVLSSLLCLGFAEYPRAGSSCNQTLDCWEEYEFCNDFDRCEHRDLVPIRSMELWGYVVYTAAVFVSNFSGITGALPLVAIVAMQKFTMKDGIMLSNAQIAAAGIARLALDRNKKHPIRKTWGILLDYPVLTMMLPMVTTGSILATVVSRLLPDIVIVICYAIIMVGILAFNF